MDRIEIKPARNKKTKIRFATRGLKTKKCIIFFIMECGSL